MAKRHPSLIPLTHDHHHVLAAARLLILSAESSGSARAAAANDFVTFFDTEVKLHVREEEEILFPKLFRIDSYPPEELVTALVDHWRMQGMVERLRDEIASGEATPALMRRIGEALRAHVRLEEQRLFPLIEKALSPGDLETIAFSARHRESEVVA